MIKQVASMTGVNAVVSTGMSDETDVDRIIRTFDTLRPLNKNFVVMQCTSGYPTPPKQVNLNVITSLKAK